MTKVITPITERLLLRQWTEADLPEFARLNADPEVMKYFPALLREAESNALAEKFRSLIMERGWGFWVAELTATKTFIGFVGLHVPTYLLPVSPCVEIGWRISKEHWGKGFATKAAQAALNVAFNMLELDNVYSFTSVTNKKSQAVMERLQMQNTGNNFEHPMVPAGHILREHVLYCIDHVHWLKCNA